MSERQITTDGAARSFAAAQHLHRAGHLAEAEILYNDVLRTVTDYPEALLFLGLLRHQQGHGEAALVLMRQAIAHSPGVPRITTTTLQWCRLDWDGQQRP